jgi:hypothetical protein
MEAVMVRPNQKIEYEPEPGYEVTILNASFVFGQAVLLSAMKMYDRYIHVQVLSGRKYMSLADFINQLLVRGMVEYDKKPWDVEQDLAAELKSNIENQNKRH